MNKIITPYMKIILASLIFGSSGAFVKYIDLPIVLISFFRTAIPSAFLIFYFIIFKKKITTISIKLMLFASLLNAVRIFLFFVGFTYADISSAVLTLPINGISIGPLICLAFKYNPKLPLAGVA